MACLFNVDFEGFLETWSPARCVCWTVGSLLFQQAVVTGASTLLLRATPQGIKRGLFRRPVLHYEIWRYDIKQAPATVKDRLLKSAFRAASAFLLFKACSASQQWWGARSSVARSFAQVLTPFPTWAHLYAFTEGFGAGFSSLFGLRLTFRCDAAARVFRAERACGALAETLVATCKLIRGRIEDCRGLSSNNHRPRVLAKNKITVPWSLDFWDWFGSTAVAWCRMHDSTPPMLSLIPESWLDNEERITLSLLTWRVREDCLRYLYERAIHSVLVDRLNVQEAGEEKMVREVFSHARDIGFLTLQQRHHWNYQLSTWSSAGPNLSLRVASAHMMVMLGTWQSLKEKMDDDTVLKSSHVKHVLYRRNSEQLAALVKQDPTAQCTICLEELDHGDGGGVVRLFPCKHLLHLKCVTNWISESLSCPLCRQDLDTNPVPVMEGQLASGRGDPPITTPEARAHHVDFILESKVQMQAQALDQTLPAGLRHRSAWAAHYFILTLYYFRAAPGAIESFSPFKFGAIFSSFWAPLWHMVWDTSV